MRPAPSLDPLDPLAAIPSDPAIAALPKADLHIHQEWSPRLDRVRTRRELRATSFPQLSAGVLLAEPRAYAPAEAERSPSAQRID